MIQRITYYLMFTIWHDHLWPNRTSPIESTSAMRFLGGYDIENMNYPPYFFAWVEDGKVLGVNSGHLCADNSFRSRGLYVFPEYRGRGIAQSLLKATIEEARNDGADFAWSYPKKSSWKAYESVGFELASDWEQSELDINAYCRISLV